MQNFHNILTRHPGYRQLISGLRGGRSPQLAVGLPNVHKAHIIYSLCRGLNCPGIVLAPNEAAAARICEDLNTLLGEPEDGSAPRAVMYPSRELTFREVEGVSLEYEHTRLGVLGRILAGDCEVVVASVEAACQFTLPPEYFRDHTAAPKPGGKCELEELCAFLAASGYTRADQVEGVSQFAVRGGILDIMTPDSPLPCRIELWGDEIDTISSFDIATQRRISSLDSTLITPAREALIDDMQGFIQKLEAHKKKLRGKYGALAKERISADIEKLESGVMLTSADRYLPVLYSSPATLFDYTGMGNMMLFACEPVSMRETMAALQKQNREDTELLMSEGILFSGCDTFSCDFTHVLTAISRRPCVILDNFARSLPEIEQAGLADFHVLQLSPWGGEYSLLQDDLREFRARGFCAAVMAGTSRAAAALCDDLMRDGFDARLQSAADIPDYIPGAVFILPGGLSAGMEYPDIKFALITHTRMAAANGAAPRKRRHKEGRKLKALSELSAGDYVVHTGHGIGVFEGIVKRDMHGVVKDYIQIRYAGADMLFVPVTQLDLVSRYIGGADGANVRLNKLNSIEWQKTRAKTKAAVVDMARELIELYAKRMNAKGFAFTEDDDLQSGFEARFPYEETEDQLRCVDEIKADMQKPVPMDRLLCGDVGFGKTEVALRAIFKCTADGKQCAVLVPTTILAWQHYRTFTQRLEGYPITVELLSRFRTPKQQKEIIAKLGKGQVDVVVGTHRVVQKDVEFKDLGLCVIDEEQRFGVGHKERFKELRANIDVLTLSATPIPRTLNMAM
ncbi:MAG: DEAD/DEAH box helicase, partial [Oscillospiraceae bacterium]|nr:DEAD/DEAH box helicase [Oscillospiraceae bacterium]